MSVHNEIQQRAASQVGKDPDKKRQLPGLVIGGTLLRKGRLPGLVIGGTLNPKGHLPVWKQV